MAYRRGVAAGTERIEQAGSEDEPVGWSHAGSVLWRLTKETTGICFRYRVTGLAAEAGFFRCSRSRPWSSPWSASHRLPGRVARRRTPSPRCRTGSSSLAARCCTADSVNEVITPTLEDVFGGGRFDLISIGFLIALWSGSRALNVFIDTISIMYGLGGRRGIIRSRVLSFTLYVLACWSGRS